jgi:succinyl-diaminopimelate desuccinylase
MTIDFYQEVLKRKDDLIKDLQDFIQIPSELIEQPENKEAPFGDAVRESLDFVMDLGKKNDMEVKNVLNVSGHVEFGSGDEYVGILGHTDVVPAGNDWNFDPYGAKVEDGYIYGRGTQDDKGPTIAAFYGMKIVKELGLELSKRVRLIVGTDEESGWRCLPVYFEHEEKPALGFVPDAEFPIIYGEKGIIAATITGKADNSDLVFFKSGFRSNMVPDFAEAKLNRNVEAEFKAYCEENNYPYSITDGVLRVTGVSAHGAKPEAGINAAFLMIHFLNSVGVSNDFTEFMNKYLLDDTSGKKLGIDYVDDEMGPLTINIGVVNFVDGKVEIAINPRYPKGFDSPVAMETVRTCTCDFAFDLDIKKDTPLLYVDPQGNLVQTLHKVYVKHTGDTESKLMTIGGGTYSRLAPNIVAFGSQFPGYEDRMHQLDERAKVEDILKAAAIYAEAIYELAK